MGKANEVRDCETARKSFCEGLWWPSRWLKEVEAAELRNESGIAKVKLSFYQP